MSGETIILIAGPTASGKSAAALALASAKGAEIVNADAMQVYRDLKILTARPSAADEAAAPHHLYGVLDADERCSAGRWASLAKDAIAAAASRDRPAIIVGGTGLYFRALEEGLSPIPAVPPAIRQQAEDRRAELGADAFRHEVIGFDPAMARLPAADAQRLIRAWEVYKATGQPLSHFQSLPREAKTAGISARIVIEPDRERLYARCDARAAAMMDEGAVEEVRRLLARTLDPALPAMKALGVKEIGAMLRGDASKDDALAMLQQATRHFAKRQLTWFRNQARDWPRAADAAAALRALGD